MQYLNWQRNIGDGEGKQAKHLIQLQKVSKHHTVVGAFVVSSDREYMNASFVEQPYEIYTPEDHKSWTKLYSRMKPRWEKYANDHFLKGISSLALPSDHVPRLEDVNRFLRPLTGFQAKGVGGYVPAFIFFDCLRQRAFPTTINIRHADQLDYLPEPDIFHDIAGHVPMHTDPAFAEALVRLGGCAHAAAEMVSSLHIEELTSIIRALARFFWFTIEFGLMQTKQGLRVYGSGLLSSHGEIEHAITSSHVQRYPLQLEWVINQSFAIDHYQPLLFTVESFDHLFSLVNQLEQWMKQGKLNHVAPGEPGVNEEDLKSFLDAGK
jgi:phenylalanine-4-hydroxylase